MQNLLLGQIDPISNNDQQQMLEGGIWDQNSHREIFSWYTPPHSEKKKNKVSFYKTEYITACCENLVV